VFSVDDPDRVVIGSSGCIRWPEVGRAVWGTTLLLAPRAILRRLDHAEPDRRSVVVARVLGGRQLAQAALSVDPSPEVLAAGVWVDGAHAMSLVGLAIMDRSRVRAAVTDALVALCATALGARALWSAPVSQRRHDRLRDTMARWALARVPLGHGLLRAAVARRMRSCG
jgi:hypothetical protein